MPDVAGRDGFASERNRRLLTVPGFLASRASSKIRLRLLTRPVNVLIIKYNSLTSHATVSSLAHCILRSQVGNRHTASM